VNAPNTHTVEDVKRLYMLSYDMGLKGVTYMRDGSRQGVLERVSDKKEEKKEPSRPVEIKLPEVKPRPMVVTGATYKVQTPVGKAYITINTNGNNEPLELFINVGKAGTDVFAMAEGLGRMVSLLLRFNSHLEPKERMRKIIEELSGIGGSRSYGFGKERILSLPDAVAKVLSAHFSSASVVSQPVHETNSTNSTHATNGTSNGTNGTNGNSHATIDTSEPQTTSVEEIKAQAAQQPAVQLALRTHQSYDLCPDCGVMALAYEEGCKKCYSCGYSEC
jgi:ribonucleoside-diphosphate reductase alpha chain